MISREEQQLKQMHVHKQRMTGCQRVDVMPQVQAKDRALDNILLD